MDQAKRESIRAIIRTMYDFQAMRIRLANRLGIKKNGDPQKTTDIDEIILDEETLPSIKEAWDDAASTEKSLSKVLEKELKSIPIYNQFLSEVKGCGPVMAGVIISEFNIEIATTVSKMWQFAGLNSGEVRGNIAKGSKTEGTFSIEKTETLVRGDKRTPGFLSPYNQFLRTKLIGVLASSFIKSKSPYRKYYDDYKLRLEQSQNFVHGTEKRWCDESKGHRDNAAKRYMIKMFLKDLYVAWRELEGLEVRKPYQEEYLGHRHSA